MKTKRTSRYIILWSLLLVFSFSLKIEHRYFYRNIYLDTEVQMAATKNWSAGKGFITYELDSTDWSQVEPRSAQIFMPGYGLAVAGFNQIFDDWLTASFGLDILGLLLIYLAVHLFFWQLTGEHFSKAYRFYLLWQAFSPAPLHYLTGSGLWALGILMMGLSLIYYANLKNKYWLIYPGTLLILATGWIRDAYMFFGLIPFIWLALKYVLQRDKRIIIPMAISGALFAISLIFIHGWWHAQASYLPTNQYGFFPSQLLAIDPFPFKSFFYYGVFHEQEIKLWSWGAWVMLKLSSEVISIVLCGIIVRNVWQLFKSTNVNQLAQKSFIYLALITGLLNVGFIMASSLLIPADDWNWIGYWTFVMETRYFLPAMMFLLIWTFYLAFHENKEKWIDKLLKLGVYLALIASLTYPLWLKYQIHIQQNLSGTFNIGEKKNLLSYMEEKVSHSTYPVRYSCPEATRLWDLSGAVKIDYEDLMNASVPPISQPVELIMIFDTTELSPEIPYFSIKETTRFGSKKMLLGIILPSKNH